MSVSFVYSPVSGKKPLNAGTSSDIPALEEAFGSLPYVFGECDVKMLRAMDKAQTRDNKWKSLFGAIADAVEKHGDIQVEAQW